VNTIPVLIDIFQDSPSAAFENTENKL